MNAERKYYDMSIGQHILLYSQKFTVHKQINNIFSLMLLDEELDFDVLKKAIIKGYEDSDSLRVRLIRVKGKVKQYFDDFTPPEIGMLDFTGQTQQEMDSKLYKLAAVPIRLMNRPLSRIWMVRSVDGGCGIYFGVSHIVLDSWGICIFLQYVMNLYKALKDGSEMPKPLYPYESLLAQELEYPGSPQYERDMAFWKQECEREEPWYTHVNGTLELEKYRRRKRKPNLQCGSCFSLKTRAAHEIIMIPKEQVARMEAFCEKHSLPMQALVMLGFRTAMSARNERQSDVSFHTVVARRATLKEKYSGGSRIHSVFFRTILPEGTSFMDALNQIQDRQRQIYRHVELDFLDLISLAEKAYYPGDKMASHLAACLTFQPVRLTLTDGTPIRTKWYGNGAASQPFYLTIMDGDGTGALRCYYEYQTAIIKPEAIHDYHDYMMKVIMAGIEDTGITIGELLDLYGAQEQPIEQEELKQAQNG